MVLVVQSSSQLLLVRTAAIVFSCVSFSVYAHEAELPNSSGMVHWCIFCWAFSFASTLLVLLVEQFGLQACTLVSWTNFPITIACYAASLCLSASIIYPLYILQEGTESKEPHDYRIASTVCSCLATVAYLGEVSLARARPGEVAAYMATVPGLLKVCQTSVACVIVLLVSDLVGDDSHAALKWCMAVYCICFILSAGVVVLCVGECTGCLPFPFAKFLSAYTLLAVFMYLTATINWTIFQLEKKKSNQGNQPPKSRLVAVEVLTALNFLLYLADLAYSARLTEGGRGGRGDCEEEVNLVCDGGRKNNYQGTMMERAVGVGRIGDRCVGDTVMENQEGMGQ